MSKADTVVREILSDKEAWETSGKEDFQSLLETISAEVDEEIELIETEDYIEVDGVINVNSFGSNGLSSLISEEDYSEGDLMVEESGERLY